MFAVSRRKEVRKRARHGGRGRGSAASGGRHNKEFKHFSSRPEEVLIHPHHGTALMIIYAI